MSYLNNPPTWSCDACNKKEIVWGFPKLWVRIEIRPLGKYCSNYAGSVGWCDLCESCSEALPSKEKFQPMSKL